MKFKVGDIIIPPQEGWTSDRTENRAVILKHRDDGDYDIQFLNDGDIMIWPLDECADFELDQEYYNEQEMKRLLGVTNDNT